MEEFGEEARGGRKFSPAKKDCVKNFPIWGSRRGKGRREAESKNDQSRCLCRRPEFGPGMGLDYALPKKAIKQATDTFEQKVFECLNMELLSGLEKTRLGLRFQVCL